eukprot:CAMPEP_0180108820 /NCGR_PEP_ID=MMETSP0985-20121206/34103_1 /TAXON_ID=483367 /ORGANISM="non described non described, Strain CCMP 2436" /LENGTH=82 /DNA_ID=CAMNT_0022046583 /DNA_START=209 /DNA_END=455 /DNA_ORIENTATION=-
MTVALAAFSSADNPGGTGGGGGGSGMNRNGGDGTAAASESEEPSPGQYWGDCARNYRDSPRRPSNDRNSTARKRRERGPPSQ